MVVIIIRQWVQRSGLLPLRMHPASSSCVFLVGIFFLGYRMAPLLPQGPSFNTQLVHHIIIDVGHTKIVIMTPAVT